MAFCLIRHGFMASCVLSWYDSHCSGSGGGARKVCADLYDTDVLVSGVVQHWFPMVCS